MSKTTWRDDIFVALAKLGGEAELSDIYNVVADVRSRHDVLYPTWQASVRAHLERHSSDSLRFGGKHDMFHAPQGVGMGVWGIRPQRGRPPESLAA